MDASEFAVHLDHIRQRRDNVSPDYIDPVRLQKPTITDMLSYHREFEQMPEFLSNRDLS